MHAAEVSRGDQFEFANWARFLSFVNEERIAQAENSLKDMLGVSDLQGKALSRHWRHRIDRTGAFYNDVLVG